MTDKKRRGFLKFLAGVGVGSTAIYNFLDKIDNIEVNNTKAKINTEYYTKIKKPNNNNNKNNNFETKKIY